MKIPQSFIDQLLLRTDIVEVISTYLPLKQKGTNYSACCPFHNEKTPSFTVSQTKQFYYCFGCGAHGTALGFLINHERMDFLEAVEELAKKAGMSIPREALHNQKPSSELSGIYDALDNAQQFFQWQLKNHPEGPRAIEYLKKRGLTGEVAKTFGLGFAPPGWDSLYKQLAKTPKAVKTLLEAGLLIKNDQGRVYDRFRGRIMFPIRDQRGRVIGFGGRVMDAEEPKYLNSPETPIFQKGHALYGIFENKSELPKAPFLLIVEGYMDVIGLHQKEVRYSLATLGTATTSHHIRLLLRHSHSLVFCFDGDRAGREAAWRALKVVLPFMEGSVEARFLFLPEGEDPDSLIQKEGREAFESRCQTAQTLSNYLLNHLSEGLTLSSLEGKAKFIYELNPYLTLIPQSPYLTLLKKQIEKMTGVSENQLAKGSAHIDNNLPQWSGLSLEEQALVHLLHHPAIATELDLPEFSFKTPLLELLKKVYTFFKKSSSLKLSHLLEHITDSDNQKTLAYLASIEHPAHQTGNLLLELSGIFKTLQSRETIHTLETLLEKSSKAPLSSEEKKLLTTLLQKKNSSKGCL